MEIKNLQTPEQLFALCEAIHQFLKEQVQADSVDICISRGHELAAYMANTGKMLADAKYWKDKAVKDSILSKLRDTKALNLPASVLNELIKADNKELNYLANWCEQLDKEVKYQIEWMRTCVSKEKEQMRYGNTYQA